MKTNILLIIVLFVPLSVSIYGQQTGDINQKNSDREQIKKSNIKSKTIWEYRYESGNNDLLSDSGYKAFNFDYDNNGRIINYTKYHIFSDLTIHESYSYGKSDNIAGASRFNSAGERIETIDYKYKSTGKIKTESHTAYFNSVKPGVYFSILASISDDSIFSKLQDDLEIDPKLESYSITVNITDPDEENQYIVIGDESDASSPRFSWSQLTMESQRGLLSFKGPTRKEHTYINKNISNIDYKYNKKGNLSEKSVYNTGNDLIEKEFFRYDSSGYLTGYTKYNEEGKISSLEAYTYSSKGVLSETTGMDPSGKIVSRLQYKYDDGNNLTEKAWLNAAGEINGRYRYRYDTDNRLTEEIKFRSENEQENRQVYKYDNNGNISEIIKYDINDKKEKLTRYIYEYW